MTLRTSLLIATCMAAISCSGPPQDIPQGLTPKQTSDAPALKIPARTYNESVAPTRKEIVRALLELQDVSLSGDSSCSNVGTNSKDANLGDYISGFLAEQNERGKNWLDIQTRRATGAEPAWDCGLVIRHVDGDDRWGWGVSFQMRAKDHVVVKNSIRCTGSG